MTHYHVELVDKDGAIARSLVVACANPLEAQTLAEPGRDEAVFIRALPSNERQHALD